MINQLVGGLIGVIGRIIGNREQFRLYSEEQRRAIREIEHRYLMEEDYRDYSSSMSWYSSSASSTFRQKNDLGTSYFDSIEKRLKEEEFFKKEEFDVE